MLTLISIIGLKGESFFRGGERGMKAGKKTKIERVYKI